MGLSVTDRDIRRYYLTYKRESVGMYQSEDLLQILRLGIQNQISEDMVAVLKVTVRNLVGLEDYKWARHRLTDGDKYSIEKQKIYIEEVEGKYTKIEPEVWNSIPLSKITEESIIQLVKDSIAIRRRWVVSSVNEIREYTINDAEEGLNDTDLRGIDLQIKIHIEEIGYEYGVGVLDDIGLLYRFVGEGIYDMEEELFNDGNWENVEGIEEVKDFKKYIQETDTNARQVYKSKLSREKAYNLLIPNKYIRVKDIASIEG